MVASVTRLRSRRRAGRSSLALVFGVILALLAAGCGDDTASSSDPSEDLGNVDPDIGIQFDVERSDSDTDAGSDLEEDATGCVDDELEPSSITRPVPVTNSTFFDGLIICSFDDDWFEIELGEGDRLEVTVWAPGAEASQGDAEPDVDLWLFDDGLDLLASADLGTNPDGFTYGSSGDEVVRLRAFVDGRGEGTYDLSVSIIPFDEDCSGDVEEPNESATNAFEVTPPFTLDTRICIDDDDYYAFDAIAGSTVTARIQLDHDLGDLDMRLFLAGQADPVAESETTSDVELIELGPLDEDGSFVLVVYGFRDAVNTYSLTIQALEPGDTPLTVTGGVYYEDRPFDGDGFADEVEIEPARGFRVELVRALDDISVGVGTTDLEGWFQIDAMVHDDQDYYVRAVTTFNESTFAARVEDRTEAGNLYAVAGESFSVPESGAVSVELVAPADEPPGGAFNVLDVTWEAYSFLRGHTDEVGETLTYRWERGRAFACRSCYSNNVISLGGPVEDPDEYDDDIVLHEFGHYFQDNFSNDDSPGGSHNGEMLNPLLAYGEGMATFFSSMVQNDPEYIDLYIDSLRLRDLETADEVPEDFYGTEDGELDGDVSEYLVSAVMWDVIDPTSADEPFDTLDRETGDVMAVFMDYMRQPNRDNVGIRGIDLADFINGLICTYPDGDEPMQTLLDGDREFPWDSETHLTCEGKAYDGLPVSIARRGGELWLEGLPSATLASAGPAELVVRVDDGRGWDVAGFTCSEAACRLPVAAAEQRLVVVTGELGGHGLRASWLGEQARARLQGDFREVDSPVGSLRQWRAAGRLVLHPPSPGPVNRR